MMKFHRTQFVSQMPHLEGRCFLETWNQVNWTNLIKLTGLRGKTFHNSARDSRALWSINKNPANTQVIKDASSIIEFSIHEFPKLVSPVENTYRATHIWSYRCETVRKSVQPDSCPFSLLSGQFYAATCGNSSCEEPVTLPQYSTQVIKHTWV